MPTLDDLTGVIDKWFSERVACGEIARYTPAYNQALAAKDDLKARVSALYAPVSKPDTSKPTADAAAQPSTKE